MDLIVNKEYLQKFLQDFTIKKQDSIIINLPLSIDSKFYNNKNILLKFFQLIESYATNGIVYIDKEKNIKKTFKISEIQLDVGDVLNRHNLYFWDINEYMEEQKINEYKNIPDGIKKEFKIKAYKESEQNGMNWFKNNLDIINILLPKDHKLKKDLKLNKQITTLFKGNKKYPKIVFIRHEHWLKHKNYNTIHKALKKACKTKDSKIENVFNVEATYFYNKIMQNGDSNIVDKAFFIHNAEKYLRDEAVDFIILYNKNKNLLEFYLGWENNFSQAFRGKKMKKDKEMQKYLQNELKGADQRKFVPVKIITE